MKVELELHPIQSRILKDLSILSSARFSDLNKKKLPTDQFSFHLRRLVNLELLQKDRDNVYRLTITGKEFIGRLDPVELHVEKQGKICVMIICTRINEHGITQYLVHQRLREPFYNTYGPIIRKIKWGENAQEAGQRVLGEFAGLQGLCELSGILHKIQNVHGNEETVQDTYLYVCTVVNPEGKLIENIGEGKNFWLGKDEFLQLERNFRGIAQVLDKVEQEKHWILEVSEQINYF